MNQQTQQRIYSHKTTDLEYQSAGREFEDFIYLVSHDVRNSVRALIELPQWIEEDLAESGVKIDGPVAESIEMMNRHTGRLDRMLVDLLAFSRVGRMQDIMLNDVDLALSEVLEEIRVPAGLKIVTALDSNSLYMGERDLMMLLTQLVSNAVKHHDRAQGKVLVALHEDADDVILRISDDGPGIEAAYHEKIFGAMSTLKPRDEVEGSGMGLAIVRKIVQFYNGTIALQIGVDGRGTTFDVSIPKPPVA